MIEHLLDNNVLSQILRNNSAIAAYLANLKAAVDTTVYVEALQGQKTNAEKRIVKNLVDNYPLLHFTPDISRRTIDLIDRYSNSHNLLIADAQIAAACLEYELILVTYNVKDFRFISNLKFAAPPFPQI